MVVILELQPSSLEQEQKLEFLKEKKANLAVVGALTDEQEKGLRTIITG